MRMSMVRFGLYICQDKLKPIYVADEKRIFLLLGSTSSVMRVTGGPLRCSGGGGLDGVLN